MVNHPGGETGELEGVNVGVGVGVNVDDLDTEKVRVDVRVEVGVLVTLKDFVAVADAVYTSPDKYVSDTSEFTRPYGSVHALSGIVIVMSDVIE